MNKVTTTLTSQDVPVGSVWYNVGTNRVDLYIVARLADTSYALISLTDGNRYSDTYVHSPEMVLSDANVPWLRAKPSWLRFRGTLTIEVE
jgi:hypothetical protein